uniref:Nipped-B protein n=1 Tax=Tetraodon nigroviridis TaxID=99883 RepID=H3CUG8_TETNG
MNGDMPHVPITTLAGIASLTDLLNQLPLPSPLPATTAKSLLYNGRISEEVGSLLVSRDESLVTQLAQSLNQVSTEHIELKDNLGNDEPEGDMPVLLQALLSRNPKIFRDKSTYLRNGLYSNVLPQYKLSQNQVHGSPGPNYQQTTVTQNSPGCFSSPQSGSNSRFIPQRNSPIPSPYTPQSPIDYIQYNPQSYPQHQPTQQVSVSGRVRNICDNKVSGQLSSNSSNHNLRLGSDGANAAHRLGNEENGPSITTVDFPVKSPQSACSPAGNEEARKNSRPPLIVKTRPADVPPGGASDALYSSDRRKKKPKGRTKEENENLDKNTLYGIVSSSKDSARLTLKLTRMKSPDGDEAGEIPSQAHITSDEEMEFLNPGDQFSRSSQVVSNEPGADETENCDQTPICSNSKDLGEVNSSAFEDGEMDAMVDAERIEREAASDKERWSKEVQDKDKPLKKRKQDSYPQDSGTEESDGLNVQGGNVDSSSTPKKINAESNGGSRPALLVSIDLQKAGRLIGQPVGVTVSNDHRLHVNSKSQGHVDESAAGNRPDIIKQHYQQSQDRWRESKQGDSKTENNRGRSDDRWLNAPRQKHDKHSDVHHREDMDHEPFQTNQAEAQKSTSKLVPHVKHERNRCRHTLIKLKISARIDTRSEVRVEIEQQSSQENCSRALSEQQSKPESAAEKHSRIRKLSNPKGHQATEHPSVPNAQNKHERRSGDTGVSCKAINKQQPTETKLGQFPPFLFGGSSGSLKNFVIPKLTRNSRDLQPSDSLKEPLVRLKRVSLIENLNRRAKPVVVLQRLSTNEVKQIIKESRNAQSSRWYFNKPEPGMIHEHLARNFELWVELFSESSTCEGINKRKHSMISKKAKYVETDSDEDEEDKESYRFAYVPAARKRHRRAHDKTWKCEEKRGSNEHRKGKGSAGHRREWSPDDSNDAPAPPNLSNVSRKMKKQEKHKRKKMYNSTLTVEEMLDSSTFKRFSATLDNILENLEDVDLSAAVDEDEIPQELLLGKHQLHELCGDSAKMKAMGIFHKFSSSKLVKILNILERNIQDSVKLSTMLNSGNDSMEEERLWRDLIIERVTKSADACQVALNIMTSPHMPKAVYLEDVIERVLQYTKFHLQNTLYPQYDPAYRVDPHGGGTHTSKSKKSKNSTHKQKVVVVLYEKLCDIVGSISELLEIQLLTDTTILQVSTLGITPFFVENVCELQLCAITLVTAVFSRYEKHRQLILEEIFNSLARLPTSKRNLRNFRLNSSDSGGEPLYIQMVTALVFQLIQCVVQSPSERDAEDDLNKKVDKDAFIINSYETAMRTAQNFLSVFLKKCGSKQGEEDYRPLFENFVHDLLSTVNRPEWPAAELLLSLLGRLLVHQFSNKQTEMALRVASLDYLGTVASRLRKDTVTISVDQKSIDRILRGIPGGDEVQQLQKVLLDYLDQHNESDPSLMFAKKFYIAQWYRDTTSEAEKAIKSQNEIDEDLKSRHYFKSDSTVEIMQRAETRKKFLRKAMKASSVRSHSQGSNSETVEYEDSCLIVRYLASMRPFAQSFDIYLSQILRVLGESAIAVRTKAMKCLSEVVAVDSSILARVDMQRGVHGRLMDNSTSVREAAVELVGRFVLSRPELIEQYYDMLIERILDTGISVRKRVIKILRDICLEQPGFRKITEMCVKMIRRVNDEEGIKKLVNETFQKLWFTPTPGQDTEAMTRKILNITDVVLACKDSGYDWFEQLLQNLLKSEEQASYKPTKKACVQLVDNLVEHILKYEDSLADCEEKGFNSDRLVSCTTTLHLFSKIRAQLMVKHAMTIQPYLTTKCNTQNDFMVICNVAKILELVVPLMEHPSETFLTTIEEDLMKLIIKYGMTVVQHCVSCLGAIINKVTHNYKFVWACFNRYYVEGALAKLKTQHQEDPSSPTLASNKPTLLRSLFTVGALCRHFDFDQEDFKGANKCVAQIVIKDKVLELLLYFTTHEDEEVQLKAIIGLGFQFIMHPELMFVQDVKVLYNSILSDENSSVSLKIQVLKNLQTYLQEEDSRMQEADREWKNKSKQEDLKEMGDISSGMSSSIMQIYLKQVLESFFHAQSTVRHFALSVITLTLSQGLIHPVQCVPYLIAMGTDPEPTMKNKADQQLVEIDKKYSGFIHLSACVALPPSYLLLSGSDTFAWLRECGNKSCVLTCIVCSHLYTMVRGNRQHRRAFLISLLNLFDDSSKTEVHMLLFVADSLACFPYQTQDEPLFIMHHIDITLSVSGSNLLQSFKEVGFLSFSYDDDDESSSSSSSSEEDVVIKKHKKSGQSDSDSDMDEDELMDRLPENPKPLLDFAGASQGILLLLVLKQHLKNLYGFSDSKIQKYSPTESAKVYDKNVNRKSKVHFNPRQTLDYLKNDTANMEISFQTKRNIVKQYLDFKVLMEHLDHDEEDEEGEASASARNKAINSLLKGSKPLNHNHNHHIVETDEEDSADED